VKQLNNALIFGINYGGSVWRGKEGSLYAEYPLIFNIKAENEFIAAIIWYEEQQSGLGARFESETEKQLQKIIANPFAYHFSKGNFRESSIDHFPFTIVYATNEKNKTIYISSVSHTSRNPKGKYRK